MTKNLLLTLACALSIGVLGERASAQTGSAAGVWNGAINLPTGQMVISVVLQQSTDGRWTGTVDIPMTGDRGLRLLNIVVNGAAISFVPAGVPGNPSFNGRLSDDGEMIAGEFTQAPAKLTFTLTRSRTGQSLAFKRPQEPLAPLPYEAVEVSFENRNGGVRLAGTLTLPKATRPYSAVVLISGSGPQDRDETFAGHKPFLVLADYLTRRGIAVLRVDDRGMGGSTGSSVDSTIDDVATDAVAGVEYLQTRQDINAKRIGLIGQSEGGLVEAIAASRSSAPSFIVMMSAPGLPVDEALYLQAASLMKANGADSAAIEQNRKTQEAIVAILKSDASLTVAQSRFRAVRDQVLASVPEERKALAGQQLDIQFQGMATPWFRQLLNADPRLVLRSVKCPVLAVIGETDLQVPYVENLAAIQEALRAGGNKDHEITHLPGLNHLLQTSKTGLPTEYGQLEETIAPRALETVAAWVEQHAR